MTAARSRSSHKPTFNVLRIMTVPSQYNL